MSVGPLVLHHLTFLLVLWMGFPVLAGDGLCRNTITPASHRPETPARSAMSGGHGRWSCSVRRAAGISRSGAHPLAAPSRRLRRTGPVPAAAAVAFAFPALAFAWWLISSRRPVAQSTTSWLTASSTAKSMGQPPQPSWWLDEAVLYSEDMAPFPQASAFSAADLLPLTHLPLFPAARSPDHSVTGWVARAVAAAEKSLEQTSGAAPLAFLGLAKLGERTPALIEFGARLQARGLPVVYINLGADTPFVANEAYHPIQSLLARICFVARRDADPEGVLGVLHDESGQLAFDVEEGLVESWLGDAPFVLLIDHLDQLTGHGAMIGHLVTLLQDVFLERPSRLFAFSTTLGADRLALRYLLHDRGNSAVLRQQLPLVTPFW